MNYQKRYSIYVLSPNRRFVGGFDDYVKAKGEAREKILGKRDSRGRKIELAEVWDNQRQRPVLSVEIKRGNLVEHEDDGNQKK